MLQKATNERVSKLITLDSSIKKVLTLQSVHRGISLQVYIEQILIEAAEREEERLLLQLIEEGDQEIIGNSEKADFEQYLQSLLR
jgi:hypothetical protein